MSRKRKLKPARRTYYLSEKTIKGIEKFCAGYNFETGKKVSPSQLVDAVLIHFLSKQPKKQIITIDHTIKKIENKVA